MTFKVETIEKTNLTTTVKIPVENIKDYMDSYHPAGYGTKIKETTDDGYAIIVRFNSCD
jgi:hypothetical protein